MNFEKPALVAQIDAIAAREAAWEESPEPGCDQNLWNYYQQYGYPPPDFQPA